MWESYWRIFFDDMTLKMNKYMIGNLGNVITGSTPSTKRPEFYGDVYPFITPTDINNDARFIQPERYLSEKGYDDQKTRLLPSGSVCFVCIGATIGKVCMTKKPSFTNQQINSIIVDKSRFDIFYVYYLLCTLTDKIKSIAGGAATPIVNKTVFSNVEVRAPALTNQRKIASILSAYDDLIENNLRRIKILEEMAQMIYREWFVHFRFPGHEKVKMVNSPIGKIPEGWEIKTLGDICTIVMGQSPKSEFYNEDGNGLPFHQGVTDFGYRFPTGRIYCIVQNRIAEAGDILFSVRAPVGRLNITNNRMVIGRGLCAIRSKTGHQSFVFQQLKDKFQETDTMGGGTIFKSVTKEDVHGIEVIEPSREVLNRFNEIMQPVFRELEIMINKNDNLCKTRDLLLPKLISGEIDVEQLDINIDIMGGNHE